MKKRQPTKTPRRSPIKPQALRDVRGGIGSWPTPEMPIFWYSSPVSIDTVPLPE